MACHDVTAPDVPAPVPDPVSRAASPGAPVVVWPGDLHGWSFVQSGTGAACADVSRCRFVAGPGAPPLGRGSAELSGTADSGTALVLPAYRGTRLDRVSALRYSTYRQSADPKNDASVTLRLIVQFDASDGAPAHMGRLVHEPSPARQGTVVQDGWQSWNALDGLWWLDHQAPQAIRGSAAHPCVRARPCTWAMILARFPGMTIHTTEGSVGFVTPRASFRGNVDSLVVGIDGGTTVYDFELEAKRSTFVLGRTFGDGVVVGQFPGDTLLPEGTIVLYAFAARPGRAAPLVILDDTLVLAPSGSITMDVPHRFAVESDTIYSYETLTTLEKSIADLTRAMLVTSDKVEAAQAINSYLLAQVNAGTSAEAVARAARVAQHVVIDPVRDAVALAAVDAALSGQSFHYQYAGYDGPGQMTTWTSRGWPTRPTSADRIAEPPPELRADPRSAYLTPKPGASDVLIPSGGTTDRAEVPDPENPREQTRVIFTNGIWTQYDDAFSSAILLASLVYSEPRFHNYYTGVTLYYNPTRSVQMKLWDEANPCEATLYRNLNFTSALSALYNLARCKRLSLASVVLSTDLVESITARVQIDLHWTPTNDAVNGIAAMIAAYRARQVHVLMVGHSEGVILQAQATQQLPALEQHPLEVANRCVAILALAPPMQRAQYDVDAYHLTGLLAKWDIIRLTYPTGWEDVETPLTRAVADSASLFHPLRLLESMLKIHGVVETYLSGNVAPIVKARLATLHRECIPGSANLDLSAAVVPLQQSVVATLTVGNQNNRPLLGRTVTMGRYGYFFDRTDSMTFRAMAPYDGQLRIGASVSPGLDVSAPVRIPLVRPDFVINERQLWEWVPVAAANGPGGAGSPVAAPTDPWTGAVADCGRQVTYSGSAGNTVTYELRCDRTYTPIYLNTDTLVTGRKIVGTTWYVTTPAGVTSAGPAPYYYCAGAVPCVASGYFELRGEVGIVGRSAVVVPVVVAPPPVIPLSPTVMSRNNPRSGS